MPLLTTADLAQLSVETLDLQNQQAGIYKAESLAQGPLGANRPLSKEQFTETPRASRDGIIRLSRWPIDTDSPVTVQVRGVPGHRQSTTDSLAFETLDESEFTVDAELYQITIPRLSGISRSNFSFSPSYGYRNSRNFHSYTPRSHQCPTPFQVKVTYTAGFDFQAVPMSQPVLAMKLALIEIIKLQSSSLSAGIKQYSITDFVSATAGADVAQLVASSQSSTLLEDQLSIFKKYCPRSYAV